ncbi:hypothetical protein A2U01_0008634, partial [Trifolium medium]|nr:hypothetical protein [Trifolium medium]
GFITSVSSSLHCCSSTPRYHRHVYDDPDYNRYQGHTFPRWALIFMVVALAVVVAVITTQVIIFFRRRPSSATLELDLSAPPRYDTPIA